DDPGEDIVGLREVSELQQCFADVDQVPERDGVVLGEERSGTAQEVRRRREVASGQSPPAGGGQVDSRSLAEEPDVVVGGRELFPDQERLLQVVAADLLVLEGAFES